MDAFKRLQQLKGFPSYDKGIHLKGDVEINGRIIYGVEISISSYEGKMSCVFDKMGWEQC